MKTRSAALMALGLLVLPLTGCVVVPALEPDDKLVADYSSDPTLPKAIKVAESLRDAYTGEVKDQIVTERVTAIALIAATVVAADMAIRQVSESEVLGLTLGAGALFTGTNFMVSKPQQYIYAAGANAVQCALDAVHPMRVAHSKRASLEGLIKKMDLDIRNLESRLLLFKTVDIEEAQRGRAVAQEAKNILPVAREALVALDNAGGELYSSMGRIQAEVTRAISANSPNLQSLMQQLGNALPALGAQITGVALPAPTDTKAATKSAADPAELAKLVALITAVEADLADLQLIISAVQAKPSADKLKTCSVDLQQAGLTMKVIPSGTLSVAAGTTAPVSIAGGVLPYQPATWVGSAPPADKVELATETGAGIVTIKTKADAPAGTYMLLLRDSAQGRETVNISITATSGGNTTSPNGQKSASKCVEIPQVKKVQQALISKGITTVKIGDESKPVEADGCPGPVTDQAMRTFLKSQGENGAPVPDDAIPTSRDKLLKEVSDILEIPEGT